ncbi:MAG TPA: 5'-nucleotidase [Methylococcus sp.]|nr:5'-nucleotidase [Methylococcus sp.]
MPKATRSPDAGGAVVAFTNPGGIRADLSSSSMHGEVTYGDAFRVQPFGGNLVTLTLTGSQIETMLEQQFEGCAGNQATHRILQVSHGFEYAWNADGPACDKIDPRTIRIGGASIESDRDYRVTVNDFLAEGGDGFRVFLEGRDRSIDRGHRNPGTRRVLETTFARGTTSTGPDQTLPSRVLVVRQA